MGKGGRPADEDVRKDDEQPPAACDHQGQVATSPPAHTDQDWMEKLTEMVEREEEQARWAEQREMLRRKRAASDEKRKP